MAPTICVFEDEQTAAFLPITYTRPVFDLLSGTRTLFAKIAASYTDCDLRVLCRPYLTNSAGGADRSPYVGSARGQEAERGSVLFINGRVVARPQLSRLIPAEGEDQLFVAGDQLVGARLSGPRLTMAAKWLAEQDSQSVMATLGREVPTAQVQVCLVRFVWQLIQENGAEIDRDFQELGGAGLEGEVHSSATLYEPDNVWVAPGAEVMAGAVLDARSGPIRIDEGAVVEPFSFLQGPCYIGPDSRIVSGRVRESTSIGPGCRIGGEVESSIFHGFSNKYHDGFAGHSYFGEWVNIGALTTTSDLKNTYGTVRVDIDGDQVDTGLTKLGSIVGDHVKLGIGVLLNSGSTIGTGCNLFGGGMLPKVIPCFVWGGDGQFQEYDLERMLQTAGIAMGRRDVAQTDEHAEVLRYVFETTAPLRRAGRI